MIPIAASMQENTGSKRSGRARATVMDAGPVAHFITRPRTITQSTASSTVTSAIGLPLTAMISAE
ncbi:hypothetical protein MACH05_24440 [Qipengyuania nanhaisediminis]